MDSLGKDHQRVIIPRRPGIHLFTVFLFVGFTISRIFRTAPRCGVCNGQNAFGGLAGQMDGILDGTGGRANVRIGQAQLAILPLADGHILGIRTIMDHYFCPGHPDITVATREGGTNMMLRELLEKTLDLAFVTHDRPLGEEFQALPLLSTETVWCAARTHPLAGRERVAVEELAEEPLVLFQKNFFHYEIVMHRFAEAGITPRVLHATDQLSTARRLICGGIASGFLLKSALPDFPDVAGVSLSPPIRVRISLVWEKSRHLSADMRCLIEDYRTLAL